jgi:hypothetical protein
MSQLLIDNFKFLPDVLINKIINYTDVITFRNGKYIDRIPKNDNRYKILETVPRPIKVGTNKVLLRLINYSYHEPSGYLIEYIFGNYIKATIKFVIRTTDGFDRFFIEKSKLTVIYDVNNNWSTIIDYTM